MFVFMCSLHLLLVLFDAIDKSPAFFYLDLQVISLLGLRGLQKVLTLNHINSFVSFLLE